MYAQATMRSSLIWTPTCLPKIQHRGRAELDIISVDALEKVLRSHEALRLARLVRWRVSRLRLPHRGDRHNAASLDEMPMRQRITT